MNRFWNKVDKTDTCWIWTASKTKDGYGMFNVNGKIWLAHRWIMHEQGHIVDKLEVCHSCDNPTCVNPDHLFVGTHQDNMKDLKDKKRSRHIKERKLTDIAVKDIRQSLESYSALGRKYNVDPATIKSVREHVTYREISI
jgi:hypothetical protein